MSKRQDLYIEMFYKATILVRTMGKIQVEIPDELERTLRIEAINEELGRKGGFGNFVAKIIKLGLEAYLRQKRKIPNS